jgi:hypothetical protein
VRRVVRLRPAPRCNATARRCTGGGGVVRGPARRAEARCEGVAEEARSVNLALRHCGARSRPPARGSSGRTPNPHETAGSALLRGIPS